MHPDAEIRRTGHPKTEDLRTWRVPLSSDPPAPWRDYFVMGERSGIAYPSGVEVDNGTLSFTATEGDVPEWIECIDRWIANADRMYSAALVWQAEQAAARKKEDDDLRRKAQEANERVQSRLRAGGKS
jgi:hypothetical protein